MMRAIEQQKIQDLDAAEVKRCRNKQMRDEVEVTNKMAQDRKQEKLR